MRISETAYERLRTWAFTSTRRSVPVGSFLSPIIERVAETVAKDNPSIDELIEALRDVRNTAKSGSFRKRFFERTYEDMGLETRHQIDKPGTVYEPHKHGEVRLLTLEGYALIKIEDGPWEST
jgi:hypothetical protein